MDNFKGNSIVIFNAVCNLCNSTVTYNIKHLKKEQFLFASLESDVAKEILLQFSLKKLSYDSIVLIENEIIYERSSAV